MSMKGLPNEGHGDHHYNLSALSEVKKFMREGLAGNSVRNKSKKQKPTTGFDHLIGKIRKFERTANVDAKLAKKLIEEVRGAILKAYGDKSKKSPPKRPKK